MRPPALVLVLALALAVQLTHGFRSPRPGPGRSCFALRGEGATSGPTGLSLGVPDTGEDMVRQCQAAVERAFEAGIVRQSVRLALVPLEEAVGGREPQIWTGGPEAKLERAGRPLTERLLGRLRANRGKAAAGSDPGFPVLANVTTRALLDFDGSAVVHATPRDGDERGEVAAGVFFNSLDAVYLDELEALDRRAGGDRLVMLVNPGWKDLKSWGFNLLQPRAQQRAAAAIFDRPLESSYPVTYHVLRFPKVRERFAVCIKAYPWDWQLFAFHRPEDWLLAGPAPVRLGSLPAAEEPKESYLASLIDQNPDFDLTA